MKRFHIHLSVADLAQNIEFYSKLFGVAPTKQKPDYAKWMLDDPAINFAISAKSEATGINHLGIQVDDLEGLTELKALAQHASAGDVYEQGVVTCCHAKSDKHWTRDPQGIAWEHYMTLGDAEPYGEDSGMVGQGCCIPLTKGSDDSACCISQHTDDKVAGCCQ